MVPKEEWQYFNDSHPANQLLFLSALFHSNVESAEYRYLIFKNKGRVVGRAIVSIFTINLSLFLGDSYLIRQINNMIPSLFRFKILFCGTPLSLGQSGIQARASFSEVILEMDKYMHEFSSQNKINLLCFKEQTGGVNSRMVSLLGNRGWFGGYSIPDTIINLPFDSYQEYVNQLKSRYRRQLFKSIGVRSIGNHLNYITSNFSKEEINKENLIDFYNKFNRVMSRAEVKLEHLNFSFFERVTSNYGKEMYFLTYTFSNEKSYALCLEKNNDLYFLWTGREGKGRVDYFVLLQFVIYHAIENIRAKKVYMGQTSYFPKMRLGATTDERMIVFKAKNKIVNSILKRISSYIFPALDLPDIKPLKDSYVTE